MSISNGAALLLNSSPLGIRLPPLVHDFSHACIEQVVVGPRREVTLSIAPLLWNGRKGKYARAVAVRFGGIENFAEVSAFFADAFYKGFELAWLRYAEEQHSKLGHLFDLMFERADAHLIVQCSSLRVGASTKQKPA